MLTAEERTLLAKLAGRHEGLWPIDNYHPDQDIRQAMMLCERLMAMGWKVRIDIRPNVQLRYGCLIEAEDGEGISYDVPDSLSEAICRAALAVAKEMGENEANSPCPP